MEENPELIQHENYLTPSIATRTPVFLLADGGGTTFAYHCLEPLRRPVYGIHNPHFRSGAVFEGGLREMGQRYCGFILKAVGDDEFPGRRNVDGSVDLLLGGWSLGGLLSLEVARQLVDEPKVRVKGILMVDSACPADNATQVQVSPDKTSEEGLNQNQILAQRAMNEARRMITTWKVPVWEGDLKSKRPRTVLLRATGNAPPQGAGVHLVDVYRQDRNLGWDRYDESLLAEVVDVEGHHFDLFDLRNIGKISPVIRKALDGLDDAA